MRKSEVVLLGCALVAACQAIAAAPEESVACPVSANMRGHENTEWSIGYAFNLTDEGRKMPRVLLVGDSICDAYQGPVRKALAGKMSVAYWVPSYCVTSPAYLRLLAVYLDEADYAVIHFNNGLHSLGTPVADWEKGLRAALALIRSKQPKAKIVWASSTPLKDPSKTAKARELNAVAAKIVSELGGIATDDLFSAMDPLDREKCWADTYHFKPDAIAQQAKQVAASCLAAAEGAQGK